VPNTTNLLLFAHTKTCTNRSRHRRLRFTDFVEAISNRVVKFRFKPSFKYSKNLGALHKYQMSYRHWRSVYPKWLWFLKISVSISGVTKSVVPGGKKLKTRNKSNDYFELLQYRQDARHIAHYHNRKKSSLPTHVAQKITVIRAQKIWKSAVSNLILCGSAIWRRREKFEHGCTTTNHPL